MVFESTPIKYHKLLQQRKSENYSEQYQNQFEDLNIFFQTNYKLINIGIFKHQQMEQIKDFSEETEDAGLNIGSQETIVERSQRFRPSSFHNWVWFMAIGILVLILMLLVGYQLDYDYNQHLNDGIKVSQVASPTSSQNQDDFKQQIIFENNEDLSSKISDSQSNKMQKSQQKTTTFIDSKKESSPSKIQKKQNDKLIFPRIVWVQTDDQLEAKRMQVAISAQNIVHYANYSGYEVRIVNNLNSYDWLSIKMVEFIRQTHQKSKIDLPVFQLLRLALLIEHGGISVRLPSIVFINNIDWVENLFEYNISQQNIQYLRCKNESAEVIVHHKNQPFLSYRDDFIAAKKNSSLLNKLLMDISAIAQNGVWPYHDFNITNINEDTQVISFPDIVSALINIYQIQQQGSNFCKTFRLQSFEEQKSQFVINLSKNLTAQFMLKNELEFQKIYGKRYMIRLEFSQLVKDIQKIIKHGNLSNISSDSLLYNRIMMSSGNQWLTVPKNKVRKVHFCIISLIPQVIEDYLNQIEQQIQNLEMQTFKSWTTVFFVQNLTSISLNISDRITAVNASKYEGLNLQRATTKYCDPSSLALLLSYDESLQEKNSLQRLADIFQDKDIFGAFLTIRNQKKRLSAAITRQIRRQTYRPNIALLQKIGNLFRVFTIQSYRFISHIDLRHSNGRYFDRQIPLLSMLEISEHFSPCEQGSIVYQVRRLQQFMTIPKKRIQVDIVIRTNRIKRVNMQNYQNYGKLRYRHLCGTILFYQQYVAPVETMVVFNNGYQYEGLDSHKGMPQLIPKKIHQIWIKGTIPKFKQFLMDKLRNDHPDYEYFLWSQANITRQNFPNGYDLMKTIMQWDKSSPYNKMSVISDIMRSQLIYNHGGFYLDTNYMLFKKESLNQFLTYSFVTAGQLSQRQRFFRDTAIFGAIKHSPRIQRLISHKMLSTRNFYSKRAAKQAGPGLFGKTLIGKQEQDLDVFQPSFEEFYPNFMYDPGNFNRNRCQADKSVPKQNILFTNSKSYVKNCEQIYPYAFGLDFFAEGLSWQKRKW